MSENGTLMVHSGLFASTNFEPGLAGVWAAVNK